MAASVLQTSSCIKQLSCLGSTYSVRRDKLLGSASIGISGGRSGRLRVAAVVKEAPAKPYKREEKGEWPSNCKDSAFPKGKFDGYGAPDCTVPFVTRRDGMFVSFKLKKDVPLRTVMAFTEAGQGFGTFNGVTFRGRLILPDIYEAYSRMPHLLDAPWVEAAASVPGCRFATFTMEATSQVDVEAMKDVLGPLTEFVKVLGPEAYSPLYLV